MFCDLVGSTDLSVKLDPEDLSVIIKRFQTCCEEVILRNEGYVARYMGDGLLTYFGYPSASEYDAEHAVRAGLEIVEAVSALDSGLGIRLQTRVGIASGSVVVGEVIGEGLSSREETAVGDTPNLAARLQSVAPPDGVVLSSRTRRLVGGLFDFEDLGLHQLKGFAKAVPVYRALGESLTESRFKATRGRGRTGVVVGREAELELLAQHWARAKQGRGQLFSIAGEAGIGKSRLLEQFRDRLDDGEARTFRVYASPHARVTPFHPFIDLLRRLAGIELSHSPVERWKRIQRLASDQQFSDEEVPLLASLLGIPASAGYEPPALTPPEQKLRTMHSLIGMIGRVAARRPLVIIIEDLHWLDASSIELVEILIDTIQHLPVMLITSSRPGFDAPWRDVSHSCSVSIQRLPESAARKIVDRVCQGRQLPTEVLEHVLSKAEGVPLYIEELTRGVVESGVVETTDSQYVLKGEFRPGNIPETLQDLLEARLDRLAPGKEVAQIGAVVGREFQLSVLLAVTTQPEPVVKDALQHLVDAGIVSRRGVEPNVSYLFRHALLQDSAYNALLRSRRRHLHTVVANCLKTEFPQHVKERPELLAHHYTCAELWTDAFDHWYEASQHSLRNFAHWEVIENLQRGLQLADRIENDEARQRRAFEMHTLLGSALMINKGPGDEEVGDAYRNAVDYAAGKDQLQETFPAEFGLCRYHWASGELDRAVEMATALEARVDLATNPGEYVATQVLLGISLWHKGENERALECLQFVCDNYQMERDAPQFFTYLMDFGVFGSFYHSLALQSLGREDEARSAAEAALDLARSLDNPHEVGFGLLANFIGATQREEWHRALELTDECIEFSLAQGFPEFVALAKVCRGTAQVHLGDARANLDEIASAVLQWQQTGFKAWLPWLYALLAESALLLDEPGQASNALASARRHMERQNERQVSALLTRLEQRLGESPAVA